MFCYLGKFEQAVLWAKLACRATKKKKKKKKRKKENCRSLLTNIKALESIIMKRILKQHEKGKSEKIDTFVGIF